MVIASNPMDGLNERFQLNVEMNSFELETNHYTVSTLHCQVSTESVTQRF